MKSVTEWSARVIYGGAGGDDIAKSCEGWAEGTGRRHKGGRTALGVVDGRARGWPQGPNAGLAMRAVYIDIFRQQSTSESTQTPPQLL